MATKRKLAALAAPEDEEPVDPADELMFLNLGGGNEVGRSCHIIQYKGKTVMLDAGMHPAYDGLAAMPFYDEFDLSTVDVLLISHFHIDHAASLPYVLSKTNFKGRVFMTHPTKAIYKWLVQDSVRVGNISSSAEQKIQLYTEADHLTTFPMIEAIDYYTTHTISSIRITPYPAGHVLGAAMFLIEIAGLKILFTGDYSREEDRHLISAEVPKNVKIDVLITESTYGIASHIPRLEREAGLMKSITNILNRGGRALLPVFALGRAQELLLILDEYWGKHAEFQKIPIYYASNLARKCMVVYQTYVSAMNDNIKRLFRERMAEAEAAGDVGKRGPWDFRFVRSLKSLERFDDVGACVMLASPGFMQNGVSRELLERWAPDQKNGVIITGYSVEGTMAKMIMQEPEQIHAVMTRNTAATQRRVPGAQEQIMIPRRCEVKEYSFAAHVDGTENREFIEGVAAPVVILVHGEKHNMMRLKSKLLSLNADKAQPVKVFSPPNCEELRIPFKTDKIAKVVGKLAQIPPPLAFRNKDLNGSAPDIPQSQLITGVLVQNDFKMSLMAPEDLREYAGLTTTTITCRQHLQLSTAGLDLIRWALEGTFGAIKELSAPDAAINGKSADTNGDYEHADEDVDRSITTFEVMDCVKLHCQQNGRIEVEWEGNMVNDGIADAVLAVLYTVESSPAAVKQSSKGAHGHGHGHGHTHGKRNPHATATPQERFDRLFMFMEAQFGSGITPLTHPKLKAPATPGSDVTEHGDDDGDETEEFSAAEQKELARLHGLGIPVPGIEIKVDKSVAKVWLEDLEVECENNRVLRDRVKAVVERAVETISGLWSA
ncbi:Metallo-hydrolase/oxidoreductase [Pseudovirgaria hyperparasitica]|uniref:Metallo-hydrolase/oxidoreductase n=1 Tax=Pseudovirgaria hyperparasitica TaxID=470096 RepID=A0A6A6W1W0_9PEZI|nr:Metallo-hydrolase/oxidoreductase [Pseudovirgaria hyperparasitica]KAF2756872.1 Metallo-hydrolase/oxidoreductase [Pseudovirgaria hyperparasitica]